MKNFILFLCSILISISSFSQKNTYFTSGGEMIFSFANVSQKNGSGNDIMRWAPVFNFQNLVHFDMNQSVGFFTGLNFRNVGYIIDNYKAPNAAVYKKKFRSYNLGIPFGIKVGNLKKTYFYAGYEIELPVLYKEKTFDGGDKTDKITGWFSNRENLFQHGFLVGVQFPYGMNLKFKYYLSEFHNESFTDGAGNKPYAGLKANLFYISLASFPFRDFRYKASK